MCVCVVSVDEDEKRKEKKNRVLQLRHLLTPAEPKVTIATVVATRISQIGTPIISGERQLQPL